jgi:hypothetical protein
MSQCKFNASSPHVQAAGVPYLVALYGDLHPDVKGFLERRYLNAVVETETPPQCAVTTGLLVALHHTTRGNNDVLDRVIEMDDYPWISVPADLCKEDQEIMEKRRKKALYSRIVNVLSKLIGPKAKDRSRLVLAASEPEDISRCLNCLLRDTYVSMPEKRVVSRKKTIAQNETDGLSALVSTCQSVGELVETHNSPHPILPTRNEM